MWRGLFGMCVAVVATWFAMIGPGCYEIRPHFPDDYESTAAEGEGWPPLPVYHDDPFHPANRLFQRLWLFRSGSIAGDVPMATRADLDDVDQIEIQLLIETLETGVGTADDRELSPRGQRLLTTDMSFLSRRWRDDARERERTAAEAMGKLVSVLRTSNELPELPRAPGGRSDPAALPAAHPRAPGSELESWTLDRATNRARVFELRRQRWLASGSSEAWEETPAEAEISVLEATTGQVAVGSRGKLCGACHVSG